VKLKPLQVLAGDNTWPECFLILSSEALPVSLAFHFFSILGDEGLFNVAHGSAFSKHVVLVTTSAPSWQAPYSQFPWSSQRCTTLALTKCYGTTKSSSRQQWAILRSFVKLSLDSGLIPVVSRVFRSSADRRRDF
jgi:hypothetical protein